jgi:signal transduction histidine kinase
LLISLVATGVVAALFQPLRARLQRAVDRLMFGDRDDPYAALSQLGQRLESTLAPDAVLPTIVEAVREALRLPYVAIALQQGEATLVAAESGDASWESGVRLAAAFQPAPSISQLPLTYQGEVVGRLLLAPRLGERGFSAADMRLLGDLARQAGVAVHATQLHTHALRLAAALQQSRERLVSAREEERRRLRRDLHDGLGPTLAGLTLKIDTAHDELYEDVDAAAALLRDLKGNLREAIADIRRLVHNLRPPALDELGLVAALQTQIAHYQGPALRITLDAPEALPPLPAAVEVAAYWIVTEALTNVARHAQARHCRIQLALDGALTIEVLDDGRGLPDERRWGVGSSSMRERAEELGGACIVEPAADGGTRVRARLPLPSVEHRV